MSNLEEEKKKKASQSNALEMIAPFVCIALILVVISFVADLGHKHEFSEPTCTSPAICSGCDETGDPALGHTTSFGKCSRCGEIQNADLIAQINSYIKSVSDEAAFISDKLSELDGNDENEQPTSLEKAWDLKVIDSHCQKINTSLDNLEKACSGQSKLSRVAFQAALLKSVCPEKLTEFDEEAIENQVYEYGLYLQQVTDSIGFMAEDMAYILGEGDKPGAAEYFSELGAMPKPDSVIKEIEAYAEKDASGVKQYIFLLGRDEDKADLYYHTYLRAIDVAETLSIEVQDNLTIVKSNEEQKATLTLGAFPDTGYYLIVSFK